MVQFTRSICSEHMSYNWNKQLIILLNILKKLLLESVVVNQYVFRNSTVTPNSTVTNQVTSVGSFQAII